MTAGSLKKRLGRRSPREQHMTDGNLVFLTTVQGDSDVRNRRDMRICPASNYGPVPR